jgi:hypothetical protein
MLSSCTIQVENLRVVKQGPWIPESKIWIEDGVTKYSIGIFGWRWLIDYDVVEL